MSGARLGGHARSICGDPGPTDAWTTLAGLARDTSRIRLGTLMTAATFRLPGPLAITVAQVDQMSGGRVELGIGAGWYAEEHAAYGIPFPAVGERFDRLAEQLAIITGLWETPAGATFDFQDKYYPNQRLAGAAQAGAAAAPTSRCSTWPTETTWTWSPPRSCRSSELARGDRTGPGQRAGPPGSRSTVSSRPSRSPPR